MRKQAHHLSPKPCKNRFIRQTTRAGWMRHIIWACGRSLTDTSLTRKRVISVQVIRAGAASKEARCPMPYNGRPSRHAPELRPRQQNANRVARDMPHDYILKTIREFDGHLSR